MSIKDGKLLYHLTTLDVFESIVAKGLLSRNALYTKRIAFVDTADHDILNGRERLGLSNYIPFHFHIHTSYDTCVKDQHSDKVFIYLCLHRNYAMMKRFFVLPIHPTSTEQPKIYPYTEGINKIDWDVMELTKRDPLPEYATERYRNQVRMAECLSPNTIPIIDFHSIVVEDENVKKIVNQILDKYGVEKNPPYINVNSKYF